VSDGSLRAVESCRAIHASGPRSTTMAAGERAISDQNASSSHDPHPLKRIDSANQISIDTF
jgi:hypothetical protein